MKEANIGKATNVIGSPFNIVMSNATVPQMQEFVGTSGIPEHSMIIVNPVKTNLEDESWNDICITDRNEGVKSILPFNSVDKVRGVLTTDNVINPLTNKPTGEKQLVCHVFDKEDNLVDPKFFDEKYFGFDEETGKLTVIADKETLLADAEKRYKGIIEAALTNLNGVQQRLDDTMQKYTALSDKIEDIAQYQDAVDIANEMAAYLEDPTNNSILPIDKIKQFNDDVQTIRKALENGDLENAIKSLNNEVDNIKDKLTNEVAKVTEELKNDYTPEKLRKTVDEVKADYDSYNAKLKGLVDNTKDELHRETAALQKSLKDCVNENLMPLVEAQVSSCLQDQKIKDAIGPAINDVLLDQFVEQCPKCCECSNDEAISQDEADKYNEPYKVQDKNGKFPGEPGYVDTYPDWFTPVKPGDEKPKAFTPKEADEYNTPYKKKDKNGKFPGEPGYIDTYPDWFTPAKAGDEKPEVLKPTSPTAAIKNPDVKQAIINTLADAINGAPGADTEGAVKSAVLNAIADAIDSPQTSGNTNSANPVNKAEAAVKNAVDKAADAAAAVAASQMASAIPGPHHFDSKFFTLAASDGKEPHCNSEVQVLTLSQEFYSWLNDVSSAAGGNPLTDVTPFRNKIPVSEIIYL